MNAQTPASADDLKEAGIYLFLDRVEYWYGGQKIQNYSNSLPASGIITCDAHFTTIGQAFDSMEFDGPGLVVF